MKPQTVAMQHPSQDIETLSAAMDDELTTHELESFVSSMLRDERLKLSWQSSHLIRDTLQNHLPQQIDLSFSQRVSAAIEHEPVIFAPANLKRSWIKPVMGFAMAATVASVALLGMYVSQTEQASTTVIAQQTLMPKQEITSVASSDKKQEFKDLDTYLANHAEFSTGNRVQGFMPYVRVVGYGSEK